MEKSTALLKLLADASTILDAFGIDPLTNSDRRQERLCMAFLAIGKMTAEAQWSELECLDQGHMLTSREIINFWNAHFQEDVSPGGYDDVRRQDLLPLVLSRVVVPAAANPDASQNSPTRRYAMNPDFAHIIRTFGTEQWDSDIAEFRANITTLREKFARERELARIPVTLPDGAELSFTPGAHNQLQKDIIEKFLPRYGYGAKVYYVGDARNRFLLHDPAALEKLKFAKLSNQELPDVVAYSEEKNWVYLIESVTTAGAINEPRFLKFQQSLENCTAGVIYVTTFPDKVTFRKFVTEIAWETEVWIADNPDHLVHFDGERFLGPYK